MAHHGRFIKVRSPQFIQMHVDAGELISDAIKQGAATAKRAYCPVYLGELNGVHVVCQGESFETIYGRYQLEQERRSEEVRSSPEFQQREAEFQAKLAVDNAKADELFASLDDVIGYGTTAIVQWIKDLTPVVGWVQNGQDEVNRRRSHYNAAAAKLREAGYFKNDCLNGAVAPDGSVVPDEVLARQVYYRQNPEFFARWLIGQVVGCFEEQMPPIQVAEMFAEDYLQMIGLQPA